MKVIVIAAGSGKRLGEETKNLPKYLISVNGKTIMEHQVGVLRKHGCTELIVITGPNKDRFPPGGAIYVEDKNYPQHDILGSLMEARSHISGEVLVVYSDIIFDDEVLSQVIKSDADIGIAVDLDWEKAYENRTEHPIAEAENVSLNGDRVLEIRKNIVPGKNIGEFLGIMKLSPKGSETFVRKFLELEKTHKGPFQSAPSLQKAYLTDMIQEMVDSKIDVKPVMISGKWCEIDTVQDLERASKIFS
jgi:choline kinase